MATNELEKQDQPVPDYAANMVEEQTMRRKITILP